MRMITPRYWFFRLSEMGCVDEWFYSDTYITDWQWRCRDLKAGEGYVKSHRQRWRGFVERALEVERNTYNRGRRK